MLVNHTIEPFYNKDSKILILGTMPSVKSRELGFYYMHPQNRFWKILSEILNEEFPKSINDKKRLLTKHKIALWDVLESCDIKGSSDSSIKNIKVNDIKSIIAKTKIKCIFVTGQKALSLYKKHIDLNIPLIPLPSTSPANQTITYKELKNKYMIINKYLKNPTF